jgi:hypothetical protein
MTPKERATIRRYDVFLLFDGFPVCASGRLRANSRCCLGRFLHTTRKEEFVGVSNVGYAYLLEDHDLHSDIAP